MAANAEKMERIFAMWFGAVIRAIAVLRSPLAIFIVAGMPMGVAQTAAAGPGTQPSGTTIQSVFTFVIGSPAATQPAPPSATTAPSSVSSVIKSVSESQWEKWLRFYNFDTAVRTCVTLAILIVCWWILMRIFRKPLENAKLTRSTVIGSLAAIVYFTLLAAHPLLMVDPADIIAVTIHKTFAAILVIVALRYVDRLIVVPILTRLSGGPPSRFIHQITATIVAIFAVALYCSWAFGIEVGSLLAGSAVISIVVGLALQETLGNFFSGMVLQASVPFQTNDWIMVGDIEGRVVEMTWRAVTLITPANNYILLPNSVVAKEKIVNYHTPSVSTAVSISVGLDYAIPPIDAKRVLIMAATDTPGVLSDPAPGAALVSFDDSSVGYKLNFWINEPQKHGGIEEAVRVNVWYRLNQARFGIPFPIRTLEVTNLEKKQSAMKQAATASRLPIIRKSPLFSEMKPELQEKLAGETRSYELSAGQVVYRQGDSGDSMIILEAGTVSVLYKPEAGEEVVLTELEAPMVFGELTAMTGQARSVTYKAKTEIRVIEVSREHLQGLFSEDPNLMQHFSELASKRQAQREEMLKKAGAKQESQDDHSHANTILDRAKRLFTRLHM